MKRVLPLLPAVALFLGHSSCNKEEDEGYRAAGITFRMDSGYTHQDDTVHVNDTLLIGPMISEGSEELQVVYVQLRTPGEDWLMQDSVAFDQNPMTFDVEAVMGVAPGTEEWSILARAVTGNTTRRSLTFTVVE